MEVKKSEKANLENKRFLFKEIGFVVVLLLILGAFELGVYDTQTERATGGPISEDDMEMVEVTREPEQPEAEQPKPELVSEPQPDPTITETSDTTAKTGSISGENTNIHQKLLPPSPIQGPEGEDEGTPHIRVEKMPVFPGGMQALMRFIGEKLVYPQEAADMGIEGLVVVKFVVNKSGKAVKPEILKSVNPLLDQAALDVVAKLPMFEPGEQAGEKVPVYYNLPVQFKIGK
jgi:protein TonB